MDINVPSRSSNKAITSFTFITIQHESNTKVTKFLLIQTCLEQFYKEKTAPKRGRMQIFMFFIRFICFLKRCDDDDDAPHTNARIRSSRSPASTIKA